MKILIMHENIMQYDAVGTDIESMYSILSENHPCKVYGINKKNPNVEYASYDEAMDYINDKDALIIYHLSVCWEHGYELLKQVKGRLIIRYHNITPAYFFKGISEAHYHVCMAGKAQLASIQREFKKAYWMPASAYNAEDLKQVEKEKIFVLPPFNKIERWGNSSADEGIIKNLRDGRIHLLFVGRVVPNKGHLFMLEVLRWYVAKYDKNIKLHIIGNAEKALEPYMRTLNGRIKEYGLGQNIEFIGSASDEILASYYKGCDAMLCTSFHEGFCVPIAEVQFFGLPIIALRYCAVPETIGEGQLLLGPEPAEFAAAIHILKDHGDYREYLAKKGRENYDRRFSFHILKKKFLDMVDAIAGGGVSERKEIDAHTRLPRIAFVTPWFAENIPGGAEAELRDLVFQLKSAGCDVEVLSTRVKEFLSDWSFNYYPPCTEYIKGVPVTRFDVKPYDEKAFAEVNAKLMRGERLCPEDEEIYLDEIVYSDDLNAYIRNNYHLFDLFVFCPYMFGTTYRGIQECYDKAIVLPCLHDEAYIHMQGFKDVFRKVAGMIFLAYSEQTLANETYELSGVDQGVLGGIVETEITFSPERFRGKYNINEPYILCAGRKDKGKGVDELLTYFKEYKEKYPDSSLKLVLIGGGNIEIPARISKDVLDLGFVDFQDKYDAYAAALCLCNMSHMESFSLVIMESWLCGRPVIVNSDCAVTSDFAERFNGGISAGDYAEFEQAIDFYIDNPKKANEMGKNGCREVKARFSKEAVTKKYLTFFDDVIKKRTQKGAPRNINIEGIMGEIRGQNIIHKDMLTLY